MTSTSLIPGLCPDVNFLIFSKLHPIDLGIGCQISQAWNQFCSSDMLWKQFPELTIYWNQDIKTSVNLHAVGSYAGVTREFEKFTNQLKSEGAIPKWEGIFRCAFPYNPEYQIHLELGYGNVDFHNRRPTDTCLRLFMRPISDKSTSDFSDLENTSEVCPHGNFVNPGNKYLAKQLTINNSKPGARELSRDISDIANRCVEKCRPIADQKGKIYTIYLTSFVIIVVSFLFITSIFKPDSYTNK